MDEKLKFIAKYLEGGSLVGVSCGGVVGVSCGGVVGVSCGGVVGVSCGGVVGSFNWDRIFTITTGSARKIWRPHKLYYIQ